MTEQNDQGDADRVEITWDDLEKPEVGARVEQMKAARQVPLVRAVGEAATTPTGSRTSRPVVPGKLASWRSSNGNLSASVA